MTATQQVLKFFRGSSDIMEKIEIPCGKYCNESTPKSYVYPPTVATIFNHMWSLITRWPTLNGMLLVSDNTKERKIGQLSKKGP